LLFCRSPASLCLRAVSRSLLSRRKSMHGTATPLRRASTGLLVLWLAAGAWEPAFAFKIPFHKQITKEQLVGQGFDADPAKAFAAAPPAPATSPTATPTISEPPPAPAPADNTMLAAPSTRLRTKRTQIGNALNACNRRGALSLLGEALHTTQDIYSHSNSI